MKACKHCGKALSAKCASWLAQKVFCDRHCMALYQTGRIKVANEKNSRRQSGRAVQTACQACGKTKAKLHVHHLDDNPLNNAPENLRTLCVSCHRRSHSPNFDATGQQRAACAHCAKPSIKLGLCSMHLSRYKRYGNALAKKKRVGSQWVLTFDNG